MTQPSLVVVLGMMVATLPPPPANTGSAAAPAGTANTRYCLRVEPVTGSRIETIQCRTREEWSELGLSVDEEWAANGVRVIA